MAGSATPLRDPLWIEDDVWQEAFETRVPSRERRRAEHQVVSERYPITGRERADRLEDATTAYPVAPVAAAPSVARLPTVEVPPAPPIRRTVTIKGRGAERNLPWPGDSPARRPSRPVHERAGFRPDRLAMWAVVLGMLLVFVAAISAHG